MNSRGRKFSDCSEILNKQTIEKGRSKSDAIQVQKTRRVSFDVFGRKSYDAQATEGQFGDKRTSVAVTKLSDLRLPSIVNNTINRRLSLNVSKPIFESTPSDAYSTSLSDKRSLLKTRSTQNFESKLKGQGQMNKKGGKKMRKIMSVDNFFPPQFKNRILPLLKFRRAVRTVVILLRVITTNENTSRNEVLSWAHHDDVSTTKRLYGLHGLSFDPKHYASRKEERLGTEAILILSMNPEERTTEQCKQALLALNHTVKAFGEFPKSMQTSLVRVGWYEKYEDKRVIIRQGNIADNFYFIISGTAIVTLIETDESSEEGVVRTKAVLKKGNSFGELALMHGSRRTATVTCKNEVELLAVWREDFIDIFMPHTDNKEPEHIKFLRSVIMLRGWPISQLPYHDPKICCFTYFRRGILLCRNSNSSEWIYIVKTGSCKVLKELQCTKPVSNTKQSHQQYYCHPNNSSKPVDKNVKKIKDKRKSPKCSSQNILRILKGPISEAKQNVEEHKRMLEMIHQLQMNKLQYNSSPKKHSASSASIQQRKKNVFVHIQTLVPRDTYGMEQIAFGPFTKTTNTILISDGAECILISRKFFLQHLKEGELKKLRNTLQPLPSDEQLQQQFHDTTNWEAYKTMTIYEFQSQRKLINTCI